MKRPLGVFGFSYFIALAVALCLSDSFLYTAICVGIFFAVIALVILRGQKRIIAIAAIGAVIAVAKFLYVNETIYYPLQTLVGMTDTVTLQVCEIPDYYSWGSRAKCKVLDEKVGETNGGFYVSLAVFRSTEIRYGDIFTAEIKFDKNYVTDDGTDYSLYTGIYISATVSDYDGDSLNFIDKDDAASTLQTINQKITSRIRGYLPNENGDIICGVCFGDKSGLSQETTDLFRLGGISHLLALSGLHLGVFSAVVYWLCRKIGMNYYITGIVSAVVSTVFAMLVGFSPSITRALILVWYTAIGRLLHRDVDAITILGLSCILLTFENPYAILNPGLVLSILSCYGIMVAAPYVEKILLSLTKIKLRGAAQMLIGSICIVLVTAGYSVYCFGEVSLAGVLLNVIFIPLYGSIISVGIFAGVASIALGPISGILQPIFSVIGSLVGFSVDLITPLTACSDVFLIRPDLKQVLLFYAVIAAVMIIIKISIKCARHIKNVV